VKAVILAGGRGQRMLPHTSVLPKPLMPIGDRSVLEIVIEQLSRSGLTDITLSVGYLSHLIRAVLEGGERTPGVTFQFVQEPFPLGTVGPLRLIEDLGETFLATNGDVLTSLDIGDLIDHHERSGNIVTIATHHRVEKIDFGILKLTGQSDDGPLAQVVGYDEKPELSLNVSMGVYVIERRALEWVPDGYFDFPDLVHALLEAGEQVGAYVFDGYWLDIGRHDDFEQAVLDWTHSKAAELHPVPEIENGDALVADLDPLRNS
jgi:NDP-mannose synthase